MALDGIMFEGVSVRVRRPNDYNPAAASALGPSVPNPGLNLAAIGLQAGGMNAVRAPVRGSPSSPNQAALRVCMPWCAGRHDGARICGRPAVLPKQGVFWEVFWVSGV